MFCSRCGNHLDDTAQFCSKCGAKVINEIKKNPDENFEAQSHPIVPPPTPAATPVEPTNTGIHKKMIAISIALALLAVFVAFNLDRLGIDLNSMSSAENQIVTNVKNSYPVMYPNKTYETAFKKFFRNPKWKYVGANNGKDIVQFDGDFSQYGKSSHMCIKFTVDNSAGKLEISSMEINGEPQDIISVFAMTNLIFQK